MFKVALLFLFSNFIQLKTLCDLIFSKREKQLYSKKPGRKSENLEEVYQKPMAT